MSVSPTDEILTRREEVGTHVPFGSILGIPSVVSIDLIWPGSSSLETRSNESSRSMSKGFNTSINVRTIDAIGLELAWLLKLLWGKHET